MSRLKWSTCVADLSRSGRKPRRALADVGIRPDDGGVHSVDDGLIEHFAIRCRDCWDLARAYADICSHTPFDPASN